MPTEQDSFKSFETIEGKHIALVAMGQSQLDFHMSISHSQEYDEVWGINSMCAVTKCDRVFIMDPVSRFFETFDAGPQTNVLCRTLPKLEIPVYSCELDNRVPAIELFPLEEVVKDLGCAYLNNTIAYAIAFALWKKVGKLSVFGADFAYKTNVYFGEAGRGCCEFWLSKCMDAGMDVSIAGHSPMLDTNIPLKEKLYGYHRLDNPPVVYLDKGELVVGKLSEVMEEEKPSGISGRQDIGAPEPDKY